MILSHEFTHLGVREEFDIFGRRDSLEEIPRHALSQVVSPYEQVDPLCASRQEQHRLARRVAPANYHNLLAFAPLGLGLRGGVVDAYALKALEARYVGPAVAGPGCG